MNRCVAPLALLVSLGSACLDAASLTVYLSPPGQVTTSFGGATTETFNSTSLLNPVSTSYISAIGTYSVAAGSKMAVIAADKYGGAANSQYMYVGTRRAGDAISVTLDLAMPRNYFGFWWSAGDAKNRLTVYKGGVLIAVFQTDDITALLAANPVVALNGTLYPRTSFFGNPNAGTFYGQVTNEPFAYVNLVAGGFTFDRIVFDNNGTSGFENDNHSVYTGSIDVPKDFPSFVKVVDVPLQADPTPEPGTAMLVAGGLAVAGYLRWRGRLS